MIRVTVWNEYLHEKSDMKVAAIYPEGIHGCIAKFLGANEDMVVRTATLEEPEHGLTQEVLDQTDILIWWGHCAHQLVSDEIVDRVQKRILAGMGLVCLHSGHGSKIFHRMMGTNVGRLRWREDGDMVRFWTVDMAHPIAQGMGEYFELPVEETYGEYWDIPQPDDLIFISWIPGGEVFRSGCTWHRGQGRIFYFQPGHESYPTYHDANVQKVITQGVRWAYHPNCWVPFEDTHTTPLPDISLNKSQN